MQLFAITCEKLSKESSTLNKIDIIAAALKEIKSEDELYLFSIYLTGVVYPSSVQKTINVGSAFIRDAVIKLLAISKEDWNEAYNQFGELGETVQFLLENHPVQEQSPDLALQKAESLFETPELAVPGKPGTLTLQSFQNYVEKLNQNSSNYTKIAIIAELLSYLMPLEAKYVTKLLSGRMRIGVQEPTVEEGIAKAFEVDKKLVKQTNFYIGDIGEVAVRTKSKNFENIQFQLFHPIHAMLASAEVDIQEIFSRMGNQVWAEYKYDGIRAHIHKSGDEVEIFTRDLKNISKQFPEVVEDMKSINHNFLVDGEIIPFRDGRIQAFADLQKRLGRKEKIDEAIKENPAKFIAYDFLYLDGDTLFDKSLKARRELMENTFGDKIMYSTQRIVDTPEKFMNFFTESKANGREGLMVKNPESRYESGKRGIHWLKYKQTMDPLDVVVLKAEYGEGKNAKYLSTYTFGVWDEKKENLVPVGRVYSGSTEENLKYFTEYMPTIATKKLERGYELEPRVIFEVGFENIQKSERYTSGYAVRFPRILRIRTDDKPLEEISTIEDVKRGWRIINKEQRAESKEQRAESKEQRAENSENLGCHSGKS